MNKTVAALQRLFKEFGGDPAKVKGCKNTVDVLNAISEKYNGEGGAKLTAKAIDNIANVAGNISGGSRPIEPIEYSITCVPMQAGEHVEPSSILVGDNSEEDWPRFPYGETVVGSAYPGDYVEFFVGYEERFSLRNENASADFVYSFEYYQVTSSSGYIMCRFIMPNNPIEIQYRTFSCHSA